jgi:hypothetical protein
MRPLSAVETRMLSTVRLFADIIAIFSGLAKYFPTLTQNEVKQLYSSLNLSIKLN